MSAARAWKNAHVRKLGPGSDPEAALKIEHPPARDKGVKIPLRVYTRDHVVCLARFWSDIRGWEVEPAVAGHYGCSVQEWTSGLARH